MAVVDFSKLYPRHFELNKGSELTFHQSEIGDVGCVVWDAALVLCKYLETADFSGGQLWKGKSVVELGSGTGAVGLVAATLGAKVVITDLPEFVPLMSHNITENKGELKGSCLAEPLVWGNKEQSTGLKDSWFKEGLDYVLLADCVYYEQSISDLVSTIKDLCSAKTTVLCSYEDREIGNKEEMQRTFFELIGHHFEVTEIPLSAQDPDFRSEDIHIMKFLPKT